MESNRNLSNIISQIRDEGPPGSEAAPASPEPARGGEARPPTVLTEPARRRTSSKLLFGLALPLVLIIGLVFFAGSYTGYREDGRFAGVFDTLRDWFALLPGSVENAGTAGAGTDAAVVVDEQLVRELRRRQLDITARLDQLTDTVTALSETVNRNWAANDTVVAGLRQEQQASIDALEIRLVALQRRFAETAGKSAASDPPVPARPAPPTGQTDTAKPASQTKQTDTAKPTSQTKQADTAKPASQTKQADTAKPAAQTKQVKPAGPAVQTTQQTPPAKLTVRDMADNAPAEEEWVVNIASSSREQAMVELVAKFRERGIPVERQTLTIEGDLMYRLRVAGFPNSEEARNYARRLDREFGLKGGWVSRK